MKIKIGKLRRIIKEERTRFVQPVNENVLTRAGLRQMIKEEFSRSLQEALDSDDPFLGDNCVGCGVDLYAGSAGNPGNVHSGDGNWCYDCGEEESRNQANEALTVYYHGNGVDITHGGQTIHSGYALDDASQPLNQAVPYDTEAMGRDGDAGPFWRAVGEYIKQNNIRTVFDEEYSANLGQSGNTPIPADEWLQWAMSAF